MAREVQALVGFTYVFDGSAWDSKNTEKLHAIFFYSKIETRDHWPIEGCEYDKRRRSLPFQASIRNTPGRFRH
jgi:hypothetical protein